jgi:hypothetical protein
MSGDKQTTNTPISPTETVSQHTGNLGMTINDNVQTTRSDGSVVTREYHAIGEGPVISDSSKK